jgi:hypothetical protein
MRLETRSVWKQQIGAEPRKLSRPREPIRDDQEPQKNAGDVAGRPDGRTAERGNMRGRYKNKNPAVCRADRGRRAVVRAGNPKRLTIKISQERQKGRKPVTNSLVQGNRILLSVQ